MTDIIVLMYHAVLADPSSPRGVDARYTVSTTALATHVDSFSKRGFRVSSVIDLLTAETTESSKAVAITFDDGHASNYDQVYPLLADRGMTGDFFVNSATIGKDSRISWDGLREMSEAGMSIQSHGRTHRRFDQLSAGEIADELSGSKKELEDKLGRQVDLFAPPHGALNGHVFRIAKELGYRAICSSRPGRWRQNAGHFEIPRVAVLSSTRLTQLGSWARGEALFHQTLRYRLSRSARAVLGSKNYERLRALLLKSSGGD